jgi:hypothetical protein
LQKDLHHVDVIDSTQNWHEFTRHGLHMNISGKDRRATYKNPTNKLESSYHYKLEGDYLHWWSQDWLWTWAYHRCTHKSNWSVVQT